MIEASAIPKSVSLTDIWCACDPTASSAKQLFCPIYHPWKIFDRIALHLSTPMRPMRPKQFASKHTQIAWTGEGLGPLLEVHHFEHYAVPGFKSRFQPLYYRVALPRGAQTPALPEATLFHIPSKRELVLHPLMGNSLVTIA
jgi:hypothetical protein